MKKISLQINSLYKVFFLEEADNKWLGLRERGNDNNIYSIIKNKMILGCLSSYEKTENFINFNYEEKDSNFDIKKLLKKDINIYFPYFPQTINGIELICPKKYWEKRTHEPKTLDNQEKHFRDYSVKIIEKYAKKNTIVYDPACSTGSFLKSIKDNLPHITYYGSDISPNMVKIAKQKIENVFLLDASSNSKNKINFDILICRFLNQEVVARNKCPAILKTLIKGLNNKGKIIIFGHTPINFDVILFSKENNLKIIQKIAYDEKNNGIFQYYILENIE